MRRRAAAVLLLGLLTSPRPALSQERGAVALDQAVRGLSVTARVLMVGAHPDDEDTPLIAFLARGRRVETAYLSLTRGDGGQNLIGNELGEPLGAIRTEELLAARRIDGGRQYFSRAYDFGFSKTADETYTHWNHDSLLGDVVTVMRSFRPHVIVAVFSGTPADGHGHHQVSALLAREAYDAAGDTVRFPVAKFGPAWQPLKFYRSARGNRSPDAVAMNVGEYDQVLGRGYGEISGESRSQHRSQGFFGAQQRKGVQMGYALRLASRVNEATPPSGERSIFDGIDTSFARLARSASPEARAAIVGVGPLVDSAAAALDLRHPERLVSWLARAAELAERARAATPRCIDARFARSANLLATCDPAMLDLDASLDLLASRTSDAALLAAGVAVEATAPQELLAFGDSMGVTVALYNRGRVPVTLTGVSMTGTLPRTTAMSEVVVAPDSAMRVTHSVIGLVDSRPWWTGGRQGDLFAARQSPIDGIARVSASSSAVEPGVAVSEETRRNSDVRVTLRIAGATFSAGVGSMVFRTADPLLGEQSRPIGGVPAMTLEFDRGLEWVRAGQPLDRRLRLTLKSFAASPRTFSLKALVPPGLRVDSLPATLTLKPKEQLELFVRIRGTVKAGRYEFGIYGESELGKYAEGFSTIEYPHIRPIRLYRSSALYIQAVDIAVPPTLAIAYIPGVGDDIAYYLRQLGIPVSVIAADDIPSVDLSRFTTVVVGPRAYAAHPALVANNARLLDFASKGGTLIVQYGQTEMETPGILPYPIKLARPTAERVTVEGAPVAVLDPSSKILNGPNRIGDADWAGWVQERAVYMPTTIDPHYATPLEMHDPNEPANKGAVLVAPLGKGTFVYTTLALFRQIPGGVPGGPRLFVNLLSAGLQGQRSVQP